MNKGHVSLKSIAADLYSNDKLKDMPFEFIVSSTIELIQITGCPFLFEDKEEVLHIKEHRAALPCDYYDIRQLKLELPRPSGHCSPPPARINEVSKIHTIDIDEQGKTTRTVTVTKELVSHPAAVVRRPHGYVSPMFKEGTNTFEDANFHPGADLTYKIQGNILITSILEGELRLAYRAIKLDEDGWPAVIDNASFLRALKSYIKWLWYRMLRDNEKLASNVQTAEVILRDAEQDYYANIAQAQNSLLGLSSEKMRNIANILNAAIPRQYEHASGYNDLNKEHSLRIH